MKINGVEPGAFNKQRINLVRIRRTPQPGDLLAVIIFRITAEPVRSCVELCPERRAQMNEWGWWKCWCNRKTIIAWLRQEAAKRGHAISDRALLDLIKAAFNELHRKSGFKPDSAKNTDSHPSRTTH
jgi:hypothetical protein